MTQMPESPGHPVETAGTDDDLLLITPVPLTPAGHLDWSALAASFPEPTPGTLRLPVPDGWVSLPVRGVDQMLYFADGARFQGVMPQISLHERANSADLGDLLRRHAPQDGLLLGLEPWTCPAGPGVMATWSTSTFHTSVLRRAWIVDCGESGTADIVTEYNAYMGSHLAAMTENIVAGLTEKSLPGTHDSTAPSSLEAAADMVQQLRDSLIDTSPRGLTQAHEGLRGDLDLLLKWAVDSPLHVTSLQRSGLIDAVGTPTPQGQALIDHVTGSALIGQPWTVTVGEASLQGIGGGREQGRVFIGEDTCVVERWPDQETAEFAAYHRDDSVEMVLRMVGHQPVGPSDTPTTRWPLEAFHTRLKDPSAPLPPELPVGTEVSTSMTPEEILRWWTADWRWWALHRRSDMEGSSEGMRVLTVGGFGHYLWEPFSTSGAATADAVRLLPMDGHRLYETVFSHLCHPSRTVGSAA